METECLAYASRMEVVGQQMARAADERRRLAEEARQELIAQVRRSAAREAERLQGKRAFVRVQWLHNELILMFRILHWVQYGSV